MRSNPMKSHSVSRHHFAESISWVFSLENVVLHVTLWDVSSKSVGYHMIQVWIHSTWAFLFHEDIYLFGDHSRVGKSIPMHLIYCVEIFF